MLGLADVWELLRVAEQHDVASGKRDADDVSKRVLASLVDEDEVERIAVLLAREQPRGARDELIVLR